MHVPSIKPTQGMVNAKFLSKMKPKSALINTSRGTLVIEDDMLAHLNSSKDFWYATDVYNGEPSAKEAPFSLDRGRLSIAGRTLARDDLAFLAVQPRTGSDVASVAVVGGTGLVGCRTTNHLSYFVSGVGYPDWTVLSVEALEVGVSGFLGAGFFDDDWSTGGGAESVWR